GQKGVVFCAAAGNDGKNIDNDPVYPASYNASNIITVAASDQDDKLASFSNWGKKSVDVAAPGTNILSTYPDNQYAYLQGTSMATPYVTGSVALLSAHNSDATVAQKIELLKESVDKKSALTNKVASDGRVNIYSALKADDGDNGGGDNGGNPDKNHAPEANDDSANTAYETAVVIDVLQNDSDADGDTLTVESVTNPFNGTALVENGKVKYTPNNGYSGQDSFHYTVSDGKGGEATAKVTVTVEEKANTAPEAKDDSASTAYETSVTIDVLKNDSDADGDNLSIKSITNPKHGSVKIKNSKVEYTPYNGYSGDDSFTYTVTDGKATDSATVSVEVEKKKENNNGGWFGGLSGGGWSFW
ncbi:MAG TPA: tandem-95 repeat protein, partial [Nitratifractor sp.]|nr:tandem-95 repeat protein [Nitratifractor sp.]